MSSPESGFDQLRPQDFGVMCLLTMLVDGQEQLVMMTVPEEDTSLKKSEKLRQMIDLVLIGAEMLTFPGGKIEAGETSLAAIQREIFEEADLTVDPQRLIPLGAPPFEVTQKVEAQGRRHGTRTFWITGFSYQLTAAEFKEIQSKLAAENRSLRIISRQEAPNLPLSAIRPASRGLLQSLG